MAPWCWFIPFQAGRFLWKVLLVCCLLCRFHINLGNETLKRSFLERKWNGIDLPRLGGERLLSLFSLPRRQTLQLSSFRHHLRWVSGQCRVVTLVTTSVWCGGGVFLFIFPQSTINPVDGIYQPSLEPPIVNTTMPTQTTLPAGTEHVSSPLFSTR